MPSRCVPVQLRPLAGAICSSSSGCPSGSRNLTAAATPVDGGSSTGPLVEIGRRAQGLRTPPRDLRIIGHEREVLEAEVGGGRFGRIGPSRDIEAVEVEPLAAELKRQSHAAALQAQEGDLVSADRLAVADGEAELCVEAREPVRVRGGQPEGRNC